MTNVANRNAAASLEKCGVSCMIQLLSRCSSKLACVSVLLLHHRQRFFQNVERNSCLVFAHDECRTKPERCLTASENHQPAFEGHGLNTVTQRRYWLACRLVF